jgi:hypothetical protein
MKSVRCVRVRPFSSIICAILYSRRLIAYKNMISGIQKAYSPSKSSMYMKSQVAYSIVDGRYKADDPKRFFAPSLEIYHEAFKHFLDTVRNPQFIPDDDIIRKTVPYMIAASAIYSEEKKHVDKLTPLFEKILDVDIERIINADGTMLMVLFKCL